MSAASDNLAAGLNALTEPVRATCNDPADAIRMLHALASLARASADFVPTSYDDAVAIRGDVAGVLDTEARVAAATAATRPRASPCATCAPRSSTASRRAARSSRASWSWPARPRSPRPRPRTSSMATRPAPTASSRADPPRPAFMPLEFVALAD